MEYLFSKKNAYKKFNLHDCYFNKILKSSSGIIIEFPEGVGIDAENQTGSAVISIDTDLDEINFIVGKTHRLCGTAINVSKFYSIENIQKKMSEKRLLFEIIEEYYSESRLLWKGNIFLMRRGRRKEKGHFELRCYFEDEMSITYSYNFI